MFIRQNGNFFPLGIKSRSLERMVGIIATILWRNQLDYLLKISIKYTIPYYTTHFPHATAEEF